MENTLGKNHAELITTIHNLVLLYMTLERYDEAVDRNPRLCYCDPSVLK